jgi:hypothetical protein
MEACRQGALRAFRSRLSQLRESSLSLNISWDSVDAILARLEGETPTRELLEAFQEAIKKVSLLLASSGARQVAHDLRAEAQLFLFAVSV